MFLVQSFFFVFFFFFFKQKTAYEMRISDWSSDVCSSDLFRHVFALVRRCATLGGQVSVEPDSDETVAMNELWFMHLRHTAVTRNAEAGVSVPRIAGVTGHKLKSVEDIIDRYLVRTGKMAREAFRQRLEAEEQKQ